MKAPSYIMLVRGAVGALGFLIIGGTGRAQDRPAQRLASVVSVAVEEYGKGIDAKGRVIAVDEYEEAKVFLDDARGVANRLPDSAAAPRALLDTIVSAMLAMRPPGELVALNQRLAASLGSDGALELPKAPPDAADGKRLYQANCASCHGETGMGDGPAARGMNPPPARIGDIATMYDVSPAMAFRKISVGVSGTAMPAFVQLTVEQRWNVVMYVSSLPGRGRTVATAVAGPGSTTLDAASAKSLALLEQSLNAARSGRWVDASDRAFDAYFAFEPIETPARARDPGVVASMERRYAAFKGAIKTRELRRAERARDSLVASMPTALALTRPANTGLEAFWQSVLIIVREGFEAMLVVGAVVAFLLKTGHRERLTSIWLGVAVALVASGVTAVILRTVLAALPATQEIIEGVTMLVAVAVLFSVSYWLISKVEAAKWQQFIREKVNKALERGGGRALAVVAFLAVYREGAEVALFYQASFNESAHVAGPITLGIVVGFATLGVIVVLFYKYGVKIPLRPFFAVTSVLLYYMALVFVGKGVRELQEGNVVGMSPIGGLPTVEWLGLYPTWETVAGQVVLVGLFGFAVGKTFWGRRAASKTAGERATVQRGLKQVRTEEAESALQSKPQSVRGNPAPVESID